MALFYFCHALTSPYFYWHYSTAVTEFIIRDFLPHSSTHSLALTLPHLIRLKFPHWLPNRRRRRKQKIRKRRRKREEGSAGKRVQSNKCACVCVNVYNKNSISNELLKHFCWLFNFPTTAAAAAATATAVSNICFRKTIWVCTAVCACVCLCLCANLVTRIKSEREGKRQHLVRGAVEEKESNKKKKVQGGWGGKLLNNLISVLVCAS